MEQEIKGIVFKGNSEGLVIVIPEDYDFEKAKNEIEDKVKNAARFFKGARIKVTYRGIDLTAREEEEIRLVLDKKSGAIIESFSKEDETKSKPILPNTPSKAAVSPRKSFFSGGDDGPCKFVRSTIRSGTRIEFDGSVVVLGDVNPGGEIVASGNVIVLGTLRGMVHAGSQGDREAFIYALNLRPTQIRIAEAIARMPEGEAQESSIQPELAKIKDGIIEVVQF
ncbi:MAG: septum site-determining protein MinC [Clostridiaceae bacterium]|nr:septum site-determining protein MinC [Clostridiaceae bacterium]